MEQTKKRMVESYEIRQGITIGDKEVVLGVDEKAEMPYLCAFYTSNELFGSYTDCMVTDDYVECQRAMEEVLYLEQKEKKAAQRNPDSGYYLTVAVKYKDNCAVIQFPTQELADILGSIGITQPSEKVYIKGYSDIKVQLQNGENKVADALVRLFKDDNSLRMVNEVAKAVFHSDSRVYERVEKNLRDNRYKSVEDVLRDAVDYGKY